MCLTFLVTEKTVAVTHNLGSEEDKSELAHIVGELEDQRPIHSPSIRLGEKSNKELAHAAGEQEDQIIHASHNLGDKDERELTHIVGEQEDRFTPPTISVIRTRENSSTSLVSRKTESRLPQSW